MNKALVVGGNSGIGLAMALQLLSDGIEHVYIVGKEEPSLQDIPNDMQGSFEAKTSFIKLNLCFEDYSVFDTITDIDALFITAGFGRVCHFEDLTEVEIKNLIKCNELATIQIVKKYYNYIKSKNSFTCAVMVSIAGHITSPLFSVYGASKAGLAAFIENINIELAAEGYDNRILDVSPGVINGTAFAGKKNDVTRVMPIAREIIIRAEKHDKLYIPNEEVYKNVIDRYNSDAEIFGIESYNYKLEQGRLTDKPQVKIGYLSGTFDLFHIGHLNLLRRAKQYCDYLIVGVHESGAWKGKETFIPFDERCEIVANIKYVDRVVKSCDEDSDAWKMHKFDYLFVGSDYKGTERFNRYEKYFEDKNVKIIYFPYTAGTSSTQLRVALYDEEKK